MDKVIRRREPGESTELQATGLHPILSRVYRGRGVAEAAELELDLARLIPPTQLTHADTAASLLADSLERGERILVVGDYDADGATSTALALTALRDGFQKTEADLIQEQRSGGGGSGHGAGGAAGGGGSGCCGCSSSCYWW